MAGFSKGLILLSLTGLSGCIIVAPPNRGRYVEEDNSPTPPVIVNDAPAPLPPPIQPQPTVVYQAPPQEVVVVYQDDLSPYGRWIISPRYGRVWIPFSMVSGWQPYTVGHWVYTNDGNCVWVSEGDETPWGPIVYHYGQWAFTSDMGWIWVPGTVWAPAWVAWRDGGGYCGWTPLPPECCDREQITYRVVDDYCPADRYVYVQEGSVTQVNVNQHFVRNNVTVINNTTNITNVTVINNKVVNNGVPVANIEQHTGRQVQRVAIADASSPAEARDIARSGAPVHFSTPAIKEAQSRQPAPRKVAASPAPSGQREAQLNNQLEREQQKGEKTQQQLSAQNDSNRKLQLEDQAARNQQIELQKQIQQQTQADRAAKAELDRQNKQAAALNRQQQADAARQAEIDKQNRQKQQQQADREKVAPPEKERPAEPEKPAPSDRQPHPKPQPEKPKPEKNDPPQ